MWNINISQNKKKENKGNQKIKENDNINGWKIEGEKKQVDKFDCGENVMFKQYLGKKKILEYKITHFPTDTNKKMIRRRQKGKKSNIKRK